MKKVLSRYSLNFLIFTLFTLIVLIVFAVWLNSYTIASHTQKAGLLNFSLGFVLLSAYLSSNILKQVHLPLISGYILVGILAGPYVAGLLTHEMVLSLKSIDDLALSFIALAAGGTLHIKSLKARGGAIAINIIIQTFFVFSLVFLFVFFVGEKFSISSDKESLTHIEITVLGILLGVIAIARSPSSAMAIISECKASGVFTETVLGVTVAIDVLIIIFFTFALTVSNIIVSGSGIDYHILGSLSFEIFVSIAIGAIIGKGVGAYISKIGNDLPLFLLFIAFSVTKISSWLTFLMEHHYHIHLALEPLLICMSAGFTVQNFTQAGTVFIETLEGMALPIYVLFFSVAGAALNLEALYVCWPFAICITVIRAFGIFISTLIAGIINHDPKKTNYTGWMAYLTQAGVAIGLAQLAQRQYPEIGVYLSTVVLAVISINQIIGPITFKFALNIAGEAKNR